MFNGTVTFLDMQMCYELAGTSM